MNRNYHNWRDMGTLLGQMDRWFLQGPGHGAAGAIPRVNAWHNAESIVLTAEVPGLAAEDLSLTVEGETLRLEGEIKRETTAAEVSWHRAERTPGRFRRQFILPFRVDVGTAVATCRDGVLQLKLSRLPEESVRKIVVTAG